VERAVGFLDKVLHRASSGDLPVEQPAQFRDLRTGKASGRRPRDWQARAEEVIE
jgi:hypothetical protein